MDKTYNPLPSERKEPLNQEHPAAQLMALLHSQQLSAWLAFPGLPPQALQIKGELRLKLRDALSLASAHEDLTKRLRDDGLHITQTHWVADEQGRQWCAAQSLASWQLPWEWLAQRFGMGSTSPWDMSDVQDETWQAQILPWLIRVDDAALRQSLQRSRESEHASERERLALERAALERENEHLRAQNTALQQVDAERLASFLPALYPRVFTAIGPADLALLCGRVEPLALPNPYPEPVEETLRTLQKRFRALPPALQKQIARFMADLPQGQKLPLRPEMRELVEELTGL